MANYISINNFPSPDTINLMPCMSSSRYLNAVDPSVVVSRCCIDPSDTNIVIIDFSLIGPFNFVPYCKILKVDDDDWRQDNIYAHIIYSHPSCCPSVINTNCQVYHGQLVCDFSKTIPSFLSASLIEFELGMVGSAPQSYGVEQPIMSASYNFVWEKGITVRPINLAYRDGNLVLEFMYEGNKECACNVQCTNLSGVNYDLVFCPDKAQELIFQHGDLDGTPQSILLQFSNSAGNVTNLSIQGLLGVNINSPILAKSENPRHVSVSIDKRAINGDTLLDTEYQIFKYENTYKNYTLWKDWCHIDWNSFVDFDVTPGRTYGYSVRYKGKYNDITNLSSWATITL